MVKTVEEVAARFSVTTAEREQTPAIGRQALFDERSNGSLGGTRRFSPRERADDPRALAE
ncbi:MAG: hypothetical protein R2854_00090 [Caldilineaceae bacterium]